VAPVSGSGRGRHRSGRAEVDAAGMASRRGGARRRCTVCRGWYRPQGRAPAKQKTVLTEAGGAAEAAGAQAASSGRAGRWCAERERPRQSRGGRPQVREAKTGGRSRAEGPRGGGVVADGRPGPQEVPQASNRRRGSVGCWRACHAPRCGAMYPRENTGVRAFHARSHRRKRAATRGLPHPSSCLVQ
jgi:hypothetical protein